ncbi:MAG: hypothetical protein RR983_17800 [Massilia sp.]|uniref:hypothetical protein n=1 Tax=Massilia sp. TaxID=1882437 RepID=UPI002FC7C964
MKRMVFSYDGSPVIGLLTTTTNGATRIRQRRCKKISARTSTVAQAAAGHSPMMV